MKLIDLPNQDVVGQIAFFLKGEEVGRIDTPSFTDMECRHELAHLCAVAEYDNFKFLHKDGTIRGDASKTFGRLPNGEDTDFGSYEGFKYKEYLNPKLSNKIKCKCPICKCEYDFFLND